MKKPGHELNTKSHGESLESYNREPYHFSE